MRGSLKIGRVTKPLPMSRYVPFEGSKKLNRYSARITSPTETEHFIATIRAIDSREAVSILLKDRGVEFKKSDIKCSPKGACYRRFGYKYIVEKI